MRKFLVALLLSLLLALPVPMAAKHKTFDPFQGHDPVEVEHSAVGAIFVPNRYKDNGDGAYASICSGSVIGYDTDNNAVFLTARHCVWDEDATVDTPLGEIKNPHPQPHFIQNEVVSFSANLSGPYYQTELYAISQTDDLALLKVRNAGNVIPVPLESETALRPGDPVENVSIPLDMGKLDFYGRFVAPTFPHYSRFLQDVPEWGRTMPVDITLGPGSSGSPLFDSRTHMLIGVEVGHFNETGIEVVETESAVLNLIYNLKDNSVPNWIAGHLPKVQVALPPTDRERERHPYMPISSSL